MGWFLKITLENVVGEIVRFRHNFSIENAMFYSLFLYGVLNDFLCTKKINENKSKNCGAIFMQFWMEKLMNYWPRNIVHFFPLAKFNALISYYSWFSTLNCTLEFSAINFYLRLSSWNSNYPAVWAGSSWFFFCCSL